MQRRAAAASTTASPSDYVSTTNSTFVGNTPSTVLFFLAMTVGVAIACLFIFFTARYFVRARFGLHLYSTASRGMFFSPRALPEAPTVAYSDREIHEHLEYLRTHHFLRDDFLERRLYSQQGRRRRRRRRRRGRFAKMKKLTPDEVEKLFPPCRYADWLADGDDQTAADVHSASSHPAPKDLASLATSVSMEAREKELPAAGSALLSQLSNTQTDAEFDVVDLVHAPPPAAHDSDLHRRTELHFDSGSCLICLEQYEPDDTVRGLICGHVYHAECVDPWLTRRRACCPICKRDYYKEEGSATGNIEERGAERGEAGAEETAEERSEPGTERAGERSVEASNAEAGTDVTEGNREGSPESVASPLAHVDTRLTAATDDTFGEPHAFEDLNFDHIRADQNIQALFNELVPLSERVRVLLAEHPDLNMETRARQMATKKYGTFLKVFFWRIMGISKDDLYNWAVIRIYQEELASLGAQSASRTTAEAPAASRRQSVEMTEMRDLRSEVSTPVSHEDAEHLQRTVEERV